MKNDAINPNYYKGENAQYEVIDLIEKCKLPFHLGNALKYIIRAGKKHDRIDEDLKKARWYLSRFLDKRLPRPLTRLSPEVIRMTAEAFELTDTQVEIVKKITNGRKPAYRYKTLFEAVGLIDKWLKELDN